MQRARRHWPGLAAALLALCLGAAPASAAELRQGMEAPQPLGFDGEGEALSASQYAGKVLVVSFWASWCGPCLQELPVLDAIQRKVGPRQLAVVAVNIENREVYRKLLRRLGDKLAVTLAHDRGERAFPAWGKGGIPFLTLVAPDGKVHASYRGYGESSLDKILADLNELLAAQAAALEPNKP